MILNELQQHALDCILSKKYKFFGLLGAGGTGKTSVLTKIPRDKKVAYTAPTNKATHVIEKATGNIGDTRTIYSFMGLVVNEESGRASMDKKGRCYAVDYEYLVIDEASMLGVEIMTAIKRMASDYPRLHIILMGDTAQARPVGERISTSFDSVDYSVTLTQQMRQVAEIPVLNALRNNENPVDIGKYAGQLQLPCGTKYGLSVAKSRKSFEQWLLANDFTEAKIIAWRNNTVDNYNQAIHRKLYPYSDNPFDKGESLVVQRPVMDGKTRLYGIDDIIKIELVSPVYQNRIKLGDESFAIDYVEVNGNLLCLADRKKFKAWWDNKAKLLGYDSKNCNYGWQQLYGIRDMFVDVRLSYAETSHKCQGSTYKNVFVDVADFNFNRDVYERNSLLYTAFSRAKQNIGVVL